MAKVLAPLFSFEARNQIGKALVFFPWKGVNAVRRYVIPANPQTAAQTTQRALMTAAMTEWHGATYTADDVTAFNRWAGIADKIMAGVNRFSREHINEGILGNTWERIRQVSTDTVQAAQFGIGCYKAVGGNAPKAYWGKRKTHFPNSVTMVDGGDGTWHAYATGLAASTLYYFYIEVGSSATDFGRTGIYQQRTIA